MKQFDFSKHIKLVDFNSPKIKKEILKVKEEIKKINEAAKIDWSKMNQRFKSPIELPLPERKINSSNADGKING